MESFDVLSLYTNVSKNDALQALSELLDAHANSMELYVRIMSLVKECLGCNIFEWCGRYFTQLRGLAMGQRLAPVLSICFMYKIEQPVLERYIPMYYRDC
ncbi:unnamed protein product [Strongylus vulgaris]|uniref:Reverse transcriptase domain-containing protein n=1 Tax=Strongylus vulgaris TaxID=40348 RepID=A0A3P7J6R7_STRVU|nr:unnamed protein product [Strongylus vulgaris]